MNISRIASLAVLLTFGVAIADEVEKKMEIQVVVAGDEINWSSSSSDLDLDSLAVGETKTIVNESGEAITVTRSDDGLSFDVNGETVMVPDVGMHGTHMAFVGHGGEHEEVDVEVFDMDDVNADIRVVRSGAVAIQAHHPEGVTIISGNSLDDSVKDSIRSVLISAGHDDDVTFIDSSGEGGPHVRVIKKKIEIAQ